MKILVEYDDATGNIVDGTGTLITCVASAVLYTPVTPPKSGDVDKLIRLKGAGFTAEEIIMLLASADE